MLSGIKSPEDIKKLDYNELKLLCDEIREEIMDTVSKNGGHLASNLGAVELTVAVHRAFNAPEDSLIFDVGHQSYTHKLLTGRYDRFKTIRTEDGLSGFMRPSESRYDPVVTGHSSNSISAAYGIYKANRISGKPGNAVAIIGDGALTGGIAYEGINNAGSCRNNFIVILNDNKMSISRNVGAIARSITNMRNRPRYHKVKFAVSTTLRKIPFIGIKIYNFLTAFKSLIKRSVYKTNIFECMGFNYLGPVDGHDIKTMEELFKIAQEYKRPSLIHVITTKGKGYPFAESKPANYHGVSPFDVEKGSCSDGCMTYSDVVGKTLTSIAENNNKICAVTAAMTLGTGLLEFSKKYKNRFFDVGIAEQHAVTFSAGLATGGMTPFFAVYSSFLQRAYDQIIHDCAIANLPVKLLVDRAGIVGEDGESHQGIFDVSFLSSIPNMNIYSPCYYSELENTVKKVAENSELCAVRYPRGCEPEYNGNFDFSDDYTIIGEGGSTAVVTYGRIFANVLKAAENNPDVDIIKLNKIYPVSSELTNNLLGYKRIVFFEEAVKSGGIGEHLLSSLSGFNYSGKFSLHSIDDEFVPSSSVSSALKKYGFDTETIETVLENE